MKRRERRPLMWHEWLALANFLRQLEQIDLDLAEAVRRQGCPGCQGPLHTANFERKVRGLGKGQEWFARRFALCCGRCRRRVLPPSVRFLGRRVYAGIAILVSATVAVTVSLAQAARTVAAPTRTVKRWVGFFQVVLITTPFWLAVRGQLTPKLDTPRLPASLVEQFLGDGRAEPAVKSPKPECTTDGDEAASAAADDTRRMVALLRFLSPLSATSLPLMTSLALTNAPELATFLMRAARWGPTTLRAV